MAFVDIQQRFEINPFGFPIYKRHDLVTPRAQHCMLRIVLQIMSVGRLFVQATPVAQLSNPNEIIVSPNDMIWNTILY